MASWLNAIVLVLMLSEGFDAYREGFISLQILRGSFSLDVVRAFWIVCDRAIILRFFFNPY